MDRIAIGIIRKPHGVRGEASVEPWTDSAERFSEVSDVTLVSPDGKDTREVTIEGARVNGDRALVKFTGFDSPESLRAVKDWTVEIPESQARPLEESEYFLHDLVGLTLVDPQGNEKGAIVEVSEGGGGILLTAKRPDGARFDIPFAASICVAVDLANRKMTVELPEGLDEI